MIDLKVILMRKGTIYSNFFCDIIFSVSRSRKTAALVSKKFILFNLHGEGIKCFSLLFHFESMGARMDIKAPVDKTKERFFFSKINFPIPMIVGGENNFIPCHDIIVG